MMNDTIGFFAECVVVDKFELLQKLHSIEHRWGESWVVSAEFWMTSSMSQSHMSCLLSTKGTSTPVMELMDVLWEYRASEHAQHALNSVRNAGNPPLSRLELFTSIT